MPDNQRSARARGRRIGFWSALFALSACVSLLGAEFSLRLLYDEVEVGGTYWGLGAFIPAEGVGYRHAPGFRGRALRPGVFDLHVTSNALGLRQEDFEAQNAHQRKVLLLGDSFLFGLGVAEKASFASLIASQLNPDQIGVVNGGQSGYSIRQEVLWGTRLAAEIGPQAMILCANLFNDVRDDYHGGFMQVEVVRGYRLYRDRRLPGFPMDLIRTHSFLLRFLSRPSLAQWFPRERRHGFEARAQSDPRRVMEPTFAALEDLLELSRSEGIALGIVLIPPRSGTTRFDTPFVDWLATKQIPVLDLGESGFTEDDYFRGDGHWNERGHRKAAGFLGPFARALLREKGLRGK